MYSVRVSEMQAHKPSIILRLTRADSLRIRPFFWNCNFALIVKSAYAPILVTFFLFCDELGDALTGLKIETYLADEDEIGGHTQAGGCEDYG